MATKTRRLHSNDPLLDRIRNTPSDRLAEVEKAMVSALMATVVLIKPDDRTCASAVLSFSTSKKRTVTSLSVRDAVALMFNSIFMKDDDYAKSMMAAGVERSILIASFSSAVSHVSLNPNLVPAQRHASVLFEQFRRLRALIVERFEPLTDRQSSLQTWIQNSNGRFSELEDNQQNHRIAVMKAADKFNPDKGTITSYVGLWMKNAPHSAFAMSVGESFSISRATRSKIAEGDDNGGVRNFGIPLEAALEVPAVESEPDTEREDQERLASLVRILRAQNRLAPFRGALAVALFNYTLSPQELSVQNAVKN